VIEQLGGEKIVLSGIGVRQLLLRSMRDGDGDQSAPESRSHPHGSPAVGIFLRWQSMEPMT
jgi:hypothetical protein